MKATHLKLAAPGNREIAGGGRITLEVGDLGQLREVLAHLRDIPGVARVGRR